MQVKSCPAKVKVAADAPDGQFTALVSVFNTADSVKDIVMPGAFTKSLATFAEKNAPIPVVWSHDWDDPFSHIGYTTSAQETADGLEVTGQLDLDNPKAAQVYRLLKGGRIKDFSFAYDVKDSLAGEKDGQNITELRELDVFEVGPTLVGAHRGTELRDIKSDEVPADLKPGTNVETYVLLNDDEVKHLRAAAGRGLSKDTQDRLTQIVSLAQELLFSVSAEQGLQDDGKATPAQPAAAEEPAGVKVDEPARQGTASARLRSDLELLSLEVESSE